MRNVLRIPKTLELLCRCWSLAETALQHNVRNNSPDIDEEVITQFFYAELSEYLRAASKNKAIESAFLYDLRAASLPHVREDNLRRIANGIVADVSLHRRETERVTGGDFGLLIIRPNVQSGYKSLKITDYRRGILTQAKLKRVDGKWGTFTPNQERILPERLKYLALLLYSYEDNARRNLNPFGWQLCEEISFEQLKVSLRRDELHGSLNSCEMIKRLGNGKIGTDNNKIIDDFISPAKNPSLVIRIHWPKGKHPESEVQLYTRQETQQKAMLVRRH